MEIVLKEKDAADWVYRGEGAANLVLAYTGSSPAFVRLSFPPPFSVIVKNVFHQDEFVCLCIVGDTFM